MLKFDIKTIDNIESRKMFKTILQSFYNDDYRSCIVSLYTLVVYDIVQKMTDNINRTSNPEVTSIKKELDDKISEADAKYSDIEKYVVKKLYDKKKIGRILYLKIDSLREERNNCAHFGLYADKLHVPSEEITVDYISFFYSNLFSKTSDMLSDVKMLILEAIEKYYSMAIFSLDEEGEGRINRDLRKIIENSVQDRTIKDLYNSLFDLMLLKHNDECKKYRPYTIFAFKVLMNYMNEYGLIKDLDFSRYRRLKIECLDDETFEDFPEHPIYHLIQEGYIVKDVLMSENGYFFECVISEIKKSNKLLSKYWNIVFASVSELNEYLRNEKVTIRKLDYFKKDLIEQETIYIACIKDLKSVPHSMGYVDAMNSLTRFESKLKCLDEIQLRECLSIINSNNQFYSGYGTSANLERIEKYLDNETSINKYDYSHLYHPQLQETTDVDLE